MGSFCFVSRSIHIWSIVYFRIYIYELTFCQIQCKKLCLDFYAKYAVVGDGSIIEKLYGMTCEKWSSSQWFPETALEQKFLGFNFAKCISVTFYR